LADKYQLPVGKPVIILNTTNSTYRVAVMNKVRDILEWDTVNWSVCFKAWEGHIPIEPSDCLEIGCGAGGLSLWLASKGHRVVCSDINMPGKSVRQLHQSYGVSHKISYEAIDATDIPYTEQFDIIALKSVLGGIWAKNGLENMQQAIREIHKSLKPNGKLLFAENLRSTPIHMFCRKRLLNRHEHSWQYPTIEEMRDFLSDFSSVNYQLAGFLGTFGRTETQRIIMGYIDKILVPIVPKEWNYIMAGVAFPKTQHLRSVEHPSQKRRAA
jgi:2-polyprenyl-3-methyl-5-hydroxy-6-metoxy-1,4-benzoquinol methylase